MVLKLPVSKKSKSVKSKRQTQNRYNNDQALMNKSHGQYIPFATSEYVETNNWSWKPHRKEILYVRIIYTGHGRGRWGFRSPKWVINENGIMDGLRFHKLLKQILYFPNAVLSLPSIMYDNKLFMLYLKYSLTKFNSEKYSKIFCLMIKNMEQEIAKYYKYNDCIIILNEHRSFSISVIKNGQRIVDNDKLSKKFLANTSTKTESDNCFPNNYYHYRDDYDSNFYISNVSNFDFVSSFNDNKTYKLSQTATDETMQKEALPELTR